MSLSFAAARIALAVRSALASSVLCTNSHLCSVEVSLLRSNAGDEAHGGGGGLQVAEVGVHLATSAAVSALAIGATATVSATARHFSGRTERVLDVRVLIGSRECTPPSHETTLNTRPQLLKPPFPPPYHRRSPPPNPRSPMNPEFPPTTPTSAPYSPIDMDQVSEAPPQRGSHHRRAHSETFFRFPDDLLFDVDFPSLDLPSPSDTLALNSGTPATRAGQLEAPTTFDSCRSEDSGGNCKSGGATGRPPPPTSHFRSLSVDASADFFDGLSFDPPPCDGGGNGSRSAAVDAPSPEAGRRPRLHRRNNSMDGSSSSFEADSFVDGVKKVMTPDKLAELALIDPKRARKILANRQSAARSKERKTRYTGELERKVQTLQAEATTLSTQVTMLQRDTSGLTAENRELKFRLQAMEQQAQLKDALNDTLKEEVQRLRIAVGQAPSPNNNAFNRSPNHFGSQQNHPQLQTPQPSNNGENSTKQLWPSFLDFNHKV